MTERGIKTDAEIEEWQKQNAQLLKEKNYITNQDIAQKLEKQLVQKKYKEIQG